MYIDKSTIYFYNGKHACSLSLPRSRGKIEKSFSPKLPDYFIQGVIKVIVPFHYFFYFK